MTGFTSEDRQRVKARSKNQLAMLELTNALKNSWFWLALGWNDVRQRYRGSILGPFWLTLTTAAFVVGLGPLYAQLFGLNMTEYLPYLTIGFSVWTFLSNVINDAPVGYTSSGEILKQIRIPILSPIFQIVWRNVIIFIHVLPVMIVVLLLFGPIPSWQTLWLIPGLVLVVLNLTWIAIVLGILGLRYRDVGPIVASVMQISFFLSPVIWQYQDRDIPMWIIELNPFAAYIELIRAPLMAEPMRPAFVLMALATLVLGWALAAFLFARYRQRLVYWL